MLELRVMTIHDMATEWLKQGGRKGTHLRFGQFVLNRLPMSLYEKINETNPRIWHEEDYQSAYCMLLEQCVED